MLSTGQTLDFFKKKKKKITKQTLYKWILLGKMKAIKHEIGARLIFEFDPKEVDRIEKLIVPEDKREKGMDVLLG